MARGNRGRKSQEQLSEEGGLSTLPATVRTLLQLLPRLGTIAACARAMNVSYMRLWLLHNRRFGKHAAYTEAFKLALEEATQNLEAEAMRRATTGLQRLKFHKGELIKVPQLDSAGNPVRDAAGNVIMVPYVENEVSDLLLIFLLKAQRPEVYRERVSVQHGGNVGVQHSGVMVIEQAAASAEEWEKKYGPGATGKE